MSESINKIKVKDITYDVEDSIARDNSIKDDSLQITTKPDTVSLSYTDLEGETFEVPIPAATMEKAGVMSAEDKVKLDSIEIINDLTTGGADKALSAEMGKGLKEELTELGSEVGFKIDLNNKGYIISDGIVIVNETFSYSDLIGVEEGENIILSGWSGNGTVVNVAAYDENKVFVSALSTGNNGEKTNEKTFIPSGVKYIRVSLANELHANYKEKKARYFPNASYYKKAEVDEKNNELASNVELIQRDIIDIKVDFGYNIFPIDQRLDANTVLSGTRWYPFQSATISIVEDCVRIDTPTSPTISVHSGIRNDSILSTLVEGEKYLFSAKIKAINDINYIAFWNSGTGRVSFEISDSWKEFKYEFVYDSSKVNRLQFSRHSEKVKGGESFAIKDASIVKIGKEVEPSLDSMLKGKKIAVIGDSISTIINGNNPYWDVKNIDVGEEIQSYVTWGDVFYGTDKNSPTGKTIGGIALTEEMIGTLQTFTPSVEDVGKQIGVPLNYNGASTKVWSEALCEKTGAILLANASWSGSRITVHGDSKVYAISEAWSDYTIHRCQKRKDDGSFETPDIIIIYRGTNDLSHSPYSRIDTVDLSNGFDAETDYVNGGHQFRIGYYKTIQKLRVKYPKAIIYCATLNVFKRVIYDKFPTRNGLYTLPQINDVIRDIANTMGCGLIEFDRDGITFENCFSEGYITDSATTPTHPNSKGHEVMARKAIADLKHIL